MDTQTKCQNVLLLFRRVRVKKTEFDRSFNDEDFTRAKSVQKEIGKLINEILITEKVRRREGLTVGGIPKEQLKAMLDQQGFRLTSSAHHVIDSKEFTTLAEREQLTLFWLSVSDLGFLGRATAEQVFKRAEELGLELCPVEAGIYQRLKDITQPGGKDYMIATEKMADWIGEPCLFELESFSNVNSRFHYWLHAKITYSDTEWLPGQMIVFRFRPNSEEASSGE